MNIIVNKITTAIACINTNRNFIGFELDEDYYNIANKRILENQKSTDDTNKLNIE